MSFTLKQQVTFLRQLVKERETAWPIRVEMGRMTKADMTKGIAIAKVTLETLEKAEAAGGVAEAAPAKKATSPELVAIVHEIHRCAKEHLEVCEHCRSIFMMLEDLGMRA